jgi:hypothetical protein
MPTPALAVASRNLDRHGLTSQVELFEGDLWDALPEPHEDNLFDLIICNPPYVNANSMNALPAEYHAEPALALAGGNDGMDLIRKIIAGAPDYLSERGAILIEIGNEYEHFKKAFSLGLPKAALNLGNLYADGLGVPKDRSTAIELYKAAADAGLVEARNLLFARYDIVYKPILSTVSANVPSMPAARPSITTRELSPVEIYQRYARSVFKIAAVNGRSKDGSQGSAVAIEANKVITNCHVTDGMQYYGIVKDGKVNPMIDFKSKNEVDLCTYQTEQRIKPIEEFRSYETLQVGEKVYAIGSPNGLENTLSEGIVSALRSADGVKKIQITAPIAPGSSGGALFDAQGRLIGITTSGFEMVGNLNFAVSIDEAP